MASSLSLSAASCWWKLMRGMASPPGDGIIRALYCDADVKQPCEYAATGGKPGDTRAREARPKTIAWRLVAECRVEVVAVADDEGGTDQQNQAQSDQQFGARAGSIPLLEEDAP